MIISISGEEIILKSNIFKNRCQKCTNLCGIWPDTKYSRNKLCIQIKVCCCKTMVKIDLILEMRRKVIFYIL